MEKGRIRLMAGLGFMLTGFGVSCVIPMVFSMAGRSAGMGMDNRPAKKARSGNCRLN